MKCLHSRKLGGKKRERLEMEFPHQPCKEGEKASATETEFVPRKIKRNRDKFQLC